MEGTNTTMIPAVARGDTQVFQGNRLKIRISVGGNEFELTDERASNQPASVNVQELVGAYAGAVRATTSYIPINTQLVTGSSADPGVDIENKNVRAENMRLGQILQKYDGEISHLRKLVQESKQDQEEFKARYRAATHIKAAEIAQLLPRGNTEQNVAHGRGLPVRTKLAEPFTAELNPREFKLNAQVREIDIPNLEDVLGNDKKADVTFKRTANSLAMEDSHALMENSETGSRAVPGGDEKYFDGLTAGIYALNHAGPPSVVKIGLDADLARAGGECRVDDSHGSPLRRSPPRRGRANNFDSIADQEFFMQTDEGKASSRDHLGMVDTYGVTHKPNPDNGDCHRAVRIGNLPQDIDYERLLAKVRGGCIISAVLCDTTKIRGFGGHMSALVVFMKAEAAKAYVQFANKHGIYFGTQKALVELIHTPSYPLSVQTEKRLSMSHTRYLVLPKCDSELFLAKIDRIINADVNGYRVEAMGKLWKDDYGHIHIRFASISAAGMAFARLIKDPYSNQAMPSFEPDPCGRPLSDLLPTLRGRKFNNFISTKVNYDDNDEDDDRDKGDVKLNWAKQPAVTNVKNIDEIDLEHTNQDESDNNSGEGRGNKNGHADHEQERKTDNMAMAIKEIKTVNEGSMTDILKTSSKVKTPDTVTAVDKKPSKVEIGKEIHGNTIPQISKAEVLPSTHNAPTLEEVYSSLVAKDSNVLESVAFSPMIPRIGNPVSDGQSNTKSVAPSAANEGLDLQAGKAIEAVESGALKAPVELKAVLPVTTPVVDTIGEVVHPVVRFPPPIVGQPLMCDSFQKDSVTDAVADIVRGSITDTGKDTVTERSKETPVVEALITATSVKQLDTAETSAIAASVTVPPVRANGEPSVSLPSKVSAAIPDKYDLSGTNLDPTFLVRYGIEKVLSAKPRGGLSSSRWATPETETTAPIVIEAPLAAPSLTDSQKACEMFLFGAPLTPTIPTALLSFPLAPSNAPKEPLAAVPVSISAITDVKQKAPVKDQRVAIQKTTLSVEASQQPSGTKETDAVPIPKPVLSAPSLPPRKLLPNGLATSRYASLGPDASTDRPRSNLRDFYSAVDRPGAARKKT